MISRSHHVFRICTLSSFRLFWRGDVLKPLVGTLGLDYRNVNIDWVIRTQGTFSVSHSDSSKAVNIFLQHQLL